MNKKISIVIPVYNVEKYLDKMLNSLYNQTFRDFELIIINDGSTDNSENIILKYQNLYSNIIYLKQNNQGVSEARNNAILKVTGKYTLFLDSDDYLHENMLERMYNKAEEAQANIVICGFKKVFDYKNDKSDSLELYDLDDSSIYSNYDVMNMMMESKVGGFLWNKLFLTKDIVESKMYFEKGRYIQDWYPVFKQVSLAKRIAFINEPLYYYRQRMGSNLHRKSVKQIEDYNFAAKSIVEYIMKNDFKLKNEKYNKFICDVQASQIHDYVNLGTKCNKEVYNRCKIMNISILKILYNLKLSLKTKIKFTLFEARILHLFY